MKSSRTLSVALLLLFFASGFAALLYQVVWQRMLTLITGLDLQATTMIVAAFMLGMGFGNLAGGHLADRLQPRRLLIVFAVAELGVAMFALASKALYIDWFYWSLTPRVESPGLLAITACLTLLVPTFCMGLTLPVLAKVVTHQVEAAAGRIAGLYGWNTLGAAAGAWLGSAYLIRGFGYEQSLWCGAALNLAAGLTALALLRSTEPVAVPAAGNPAANAASADTAPAPTALTFRTWLLLYFVSGFVALGLEIVWFRLLGMMLKSTAFTFPLLLAFYLLGVGAGSLFGRPLARSSRDPMRGFLRMQAWIPLYAAASVFAMTVAIDHVALLKPARDYLAGSDGVRFVFDFGVLDSNQALFYLGLPALLVLPPTVLMGMSFPFLQRAVQSDISRLGRRVGWLQATNILGCTVGVVLVGLVMLDRLGTPGTLAVMAVLSVAFSGPSAWNAREAARRPLRLAMALALALAGAWIVPAADRLWASVHGATPEKIIHAEDGSGVAVVRSDEGEWKRSTVFANGLGQSWIPFGWVHTWLGLMPVLLHPEPKTIAVIGLGSGDTVFSLGGRPETTAIHCIEIMGKQVETLRTLNARAPYGGLRSLLDDKRIIQVHGDGRRYVMQGRRQFDIIEADALRPHSAYAGSLYSREYFELLRRNLARGGFAVTWSPTERIQQTFLSVFPHVVHVPPMYIGSNEPIVFDPDAVRTRAASDAVRSYYARAGIDIGPMVEELLENFRHVPRPDGPPPDSLLNTDLFPRDELSAQR
ncbi:MAG TPA: MFS transporter [Planctomycetota bacterium]